jgi:outer membrane protein
MLVRSFKHRMNRTLVLTALAAGLATSTLAAQTPAAAAPAAPPAAVAPQAIPSKVAVIAFEQVVVATNEGQKAVNDIQKKYEPKKAAIETAGNELDSLKKQLQALPATASDEERASRMKVIDKKEKDLQHDVETAQTDYQSDLQEAYGKVAQKVGAAAVKYAQDNGFTLLVNIGGNQQAPTPFFWWAPQSDISQAVVNDYNKSSGIAAPTPSAPSAPKPRPATAPKPATKP